MVWLLRRGLVDRLVLAVELVAVVLWNRRHLVSIRNRHKMGHYKVMQCCTTCSVIYRMALIYKCSGSMQNKRGALIRVLDNVP